MKVKFDNIVAGVMGIGALGIVGYAVIAQNNTQALGAVTTLLIAAAGLYYHAKTTADAVVAARRYGEEHPTDPNQPVRPPPRG